MRARDLRVALLVLRVGLGVFLLLSIDKIVAPEQTAKIFQFFYKTPLPAGFAPVVGVLEAALSLALLAGLWKTWTYGAALVLHAISTLSTWEKLLAPFGENHLFIAALPVLSAFVVLFLLRRDDTLFTLGGSAAQAETLRNGFALEPASIPVSEILSGGPPRDGIPALDHPPAIPAAQAEWAEDELVFGVFSRYTTA